MSYGMSLGAAEGFQRPVSMPLTVSDVARPATLARLVPLPLRASGNREGARACQNTPHIIRLPPCLAKARKADRRQLKARVVKPFTLQV